jgi:pectinesterase
MHLFRVSMLAGVVLLLAVVGSLNGSPASAPEAVVRIVLVGDSTVTESAGWELGFKQFLTDRAECRNLARGGRSSMSFVREGRWDAALALKADYYLIQFGHDDYRAYMNRYVDEARAIGATPVLVTSLTRRQFAADDAHRINSSLVPRVEIVRQIAVARQVPLVELHDLSKALCERLGREGCYAFSPRKEDGDYDGTHLNAAGSVIFARLVVDELRAEVPALATVLRAEPVAENPLQPGPDYDAVVAVDGSGTHLTVQAAIDSAPAGATSSYVILVRPGVYKEHVVVPPAKPFIVLRGMENEAAATIVTLDTHVKTPAGEGRTLSTRESATVLVQADNFTAENITFENTTTLEQRVQALAMYVEADRAIFRRCRFLGWQDTLRCEAPKEREGRQYFADCEIMGHVDFIYGSATAVFNRCHLHCRADGYITAASTPETAHLGYVFLDCRVTAAPGVKEVYLGRPWRDFAATAFLRTDLPTAIHPAGWHNWSKPEREKTSRYAEYNNTGGGARPQSRVSWARQLSDSEAQTFTVVNVLGGDDAWRPESR